MIGYRDPNCYIRQFILYHNIPSADFPQKHFFEHFFLSSDFTPLNILVILDGKGESIRLKSVKIVDFGPPGVVETKYTPTPQVFVSCSYPIASFGSSGFVSHLAGTVLQCAMGLFVGATRGDT